ncbi:hypothetical protein LINPERHAP1_LOCUS30927 [Linum perenne]
MQFFVPQLHIVADRSLRHVVFLGRSVLGKEMDELRAANDKTVKEMEALKAMMFRLCQTGMHQSENATSDI